MLQRQQRSVLLPEEVEKVSIETLKQAVEGREIL